MSLAPDVRQRPTRVLVFVFTIVAARWLELRTGWPDAVILPLVALASLGVFDRVAVPGDQRLSARDWSLNVVFAAVVGAILWLVGG
jgi:hypothetical protein